ncbi:hypothetical protein [Mycolicibacterium frederiksbergense]|uniref:hypothetical protein n=1 Tax=Mycolicibacterium frederiksbergense TaxID=117567 RepID=UPI00265B7FBD|nr:hypothetical protein [Mycolicibacterium frederiksbergense]MBX9920083.1 hypothetical protein [Mycolicibacterium frederiksbergense]MDO0973306.1 hypothetical protein [Mycolicibacterium frederiksbergense]
MRFLDGFVTSPFAGIAPWILFGLVAGPGRFEEAASAALGLTLLTMWVGWRRGVKVHLLEAFAAVFFGILAAIGLFAPDRTLDWLQLWAGELSNVALAVFALGTLLIRRPFTLAYAKDSTPAEHWDSPLFSRINYVISAMWALAFTVSAISGAIGGAVLHDADNFWTAWIVPIGAIIFAVSFTEFYPDYATAKFAPEAGEAVPSALGAVDWVPVFVLVTGISGLVSESLSTAVGAVLIVIGGVGSAVLRRLGRTDS